MDSKTEKALKINEITKGRICDHCLGRKFSKELEGPGNPLRGEKIRNLLRESDKIVDIDAPCYVCQDLFQEIDDKLIQAIIEKIKDLNLEFSSFVVGCKLPLEIIDRDEKLNQNLEVVVEGIKKEVNREIGKLLEKHLKQEVDFDDPQIVIMVNFKRKKPSFKIQINPLFLEGRYLKLVRGIPQTKWPCRKCKGRGCEQCGFTGKMYNESVEELISPAVLEKTQGTGSKFHGAGREDIDVKMLGKGRPFVIEIKEPRKRNLNLKNLSQEINKRCQGKVKVLQLKYAKKFRKAQIKTTSSTTSKTYQARVKLNKAISEDKLKNLQKLTLIKQRTPLRVSHRRADKFRFREVKNIKAGMISSDELELIIKTEGGLYIKELISGDKGRTIPNVSEVLGTPARCVELDVLEVGDQD